jgi:hypothetical protein
MADNVWRLAVAVDGEAIMSRLAGRLPQDHDAWS